jgi:hypothetical protein
MFYYLNIIFYLINVYLIKVNDNLVTKLLKIVHKKKINILFIKF